MDIFGVAMKFGTTELHAQLDTLIRTLEHPTGFLTDTHMEILSRLVPRRFVATCFTLNTAKLTRPDCSELPAEYRALIRMREENGEAVVVLSVGEAIVVLLHGSNHYSALVLDMVAREAYHFDSYPVCGHSALAESVCGTLHQLGVLANIELQQSVSFAQPTTQCGLYVLLLAANLEERLSTRGAGDRCEAIATALRESCNPKRVIEVRMEYLKRVRNALLLLYNASPNATEPESLEQAGVLGPLCNRTALRALCTTYSPTNDQMIAGLQWLVPTGLPVITHRMSVGTDVIGDDAVGAIRACTFCLFLLTARGAADCVDHALLMVNRTGVSPPVLFVPRGALEPAASGTVNAILARLSADRVELYPGGWSNTKSSAALPFLILNWWGMYGADVPDDELADQLCTASKSAQLPWLRSPDSGRDWMYRQLVAVALNDGHGRLTWTHDCVQHQEASSRGVRTQADESLIDMVRSALNRPLDVLQRRIESERARTAVINQAMLNLESLADSVMDLVTMHAPPRWNWSCGVDEVRKIYYYIVRKHAQSARVSEGVESLIREARRTVEENDNVDSVQTVVTPVLDCLLMTWPYMLVDQSPAGDDYVALEPCDLGYADAVTKMLSQSPDDDIGLILCPVMLVDAQRSLDIVPMARVPSMLTNNELSIWGGGVPPNGRHLGVALQHLGGSRERSATFVPGEHSALQLSNNDILCPVFTDFSRLPMATVRATSSSAALSMPSFVGQSVPSAARAQLGQVVTPSRGVQQLPDLMDW